MNGNIPRKEWNIIVLLLLSTLVVFIAGTGGHLYSGDEEVNYVLAESIYHFHQFSLNNETSYSRAYTAYYDVTLFCRGHLSGSHGGRCYSWFGITEPVLAIPFIALAEFTGITPWMFVEILFYPIVTSVTCALIYLMGLKLGYSRKVSVLLAFVYGFSTFALPYSKFFNDGPLQVLFVVGAVLFLIGSRQSLVQAGTLVGFAVLTRIATVVIIPPIIVYVIWRNRHSVVRVLHFLLPICVALAVFAGYNFVRFGSLTDFGQGYSQSIGAYSATCQGIQRLLISPGVGLIYYFPLVLLVPYGAYRLFLTRASEVLLFASFFIVSLVSSGSYCLVNFGFGSYNWIGWGHWGPRYLMGALPFLVLMLGKCITENSIRGALRLTFYALFAVGVFVNALGELVWFQVGFALVWGKFGSEWIPHALWQPEYSPIWEHFKVALGFVRDSQEIYPTNFGFGSITHQAYDPLLVNAFGPGIALLIVALPLALLLYLLKRALHQSQTAR